MMENLLKIRNSLTSPITVHHWWRHCVVVGFELTQSALSRLLIFGDAYLGGFEMLT
jgi:hypothetical protein